VTAGVLSRLRPVTHFNVHDPRAGLFRGADDGAGVGVKQIRILRRSTVCRYRRNVRRNIWLGFVQ
jgi:hypothetical protein